MERSKKSCLTMLMATHIVVNKSRSCLLKLSLSLELEGRLEMMQRASSSTAAIRVRYLHKTESSQENLVMFDWLLFLRKTKTDKRGERCVTSCFLHGLGVISSIRMRGDGAPSSKEAMPLISSWAETALQKGKAQHQNGQCISQQEVISTLYSTGKWRAETVSGVAYQW